MRIIPDICLWKRFKQGRADKYENLIIELKKPNINAGMKELTQIQLYAQKVSDDERFPKINSKWKFILLVNGIKKEIEPQMKQNNRTYGHITETDNFNIYVLTWGYIIAEAKARYEYLKEKLNISYTDNSDAINYLKEKYKQYLPEDFNDTIK